MNSKVERYSLIVLGARGTASSGEETTRMICACRNVIHPISNKKNRDQNGERETLGG